MTGSVALSEKFTAKRNRLLHVTKLEVLHVRLEVNFFDRATDDSLWWQLDGLMDGTLQSALEPKKDSSPEPWRDLVLWKSDSAFFTGALEWLVTGAQKRLSTLESDQHPSLESDLAL